MDRTKIMEAIVSKRGRNFSSAEVLRRALKYLSDTALISIAIELEINPDNLLADESDEAVRS